MFKWLPLGVTIILLAMVYAVGFEPPQSLAQSLQSPSYRFDESTLGAGGLIQSNSANYQSSSSTGDIGVGNAASASYQVNAGSQTTNDPTLSFTLNSTVANFATFSATNPAVATSTFSVSNYTSYGYIVQIIGSPPKNGNDILPGLTTETASQAGTEQFGINLVANTSPTSVGANPSHGPFSVGTVAPAYATPNKFRYISGETIATSPASSGVTTYTLTYLVNVSSLTKGGQYTSDQMLIVIGTY